MYIYLYLLIKMKTSLYSMYKECNIVFMGLFNCIKTLKYLSSPSQNMFENFTKVSLGNF